MTLPFTTLTSWLSLFATACRKPASSVGPSASLSAWLSSCSCLAGGPSLIGTLTPRLGLTTSEHDCLMTDDLFYPHFRLFKPEVTRNVIFYLV